METVQITHKVIAISINRSYARVKNSTDLYDYTRGIWRVDLAKARKAEYAFALAGGVVKEVYKIESWHPAGATQYKSDRDFYGDDKTKRKEFVGRIADEDIRKRYVGKLIEGRSFGQPIRYFNC